MARMTFENLNTYSSVLFLKKGEHCKVTLKNNDVYEGLVANIVLSEYASATILTLVTGTGRVLITDDSLSTIIKL